MEVTQQFVITTFFLVNIDYYDNKKVFPKALIHWNRYVHSKNKTQDI